MAVRTARRDVRRRDPDYSRHPTGRARALYACGSIEVLLSRMGTGLSSPDADSRAGDGFSSGGFLNPLSVPAARRIAHLFPGPAERINCMSLAKARLRYLLVVAYLKLARFWDWLWPVMILARHSGDVRTWRFGRRWACYSQIVDYVIAQQGDRPWRWPPVIEAMPLTFRAEQRGWRLLASDFEANDLWAAR